MLFRAFPQISVPAGRTPPAAPDKFPERPAMVILRKRPLASVTRHPV